MRSKKWINKDNIFEAHIIDAVSVIGCERFKRTADRNYLGDNEKKRRQK